MRLLLLLLLCLPLPAFAGGLIRDAEVEASLRAIADPVLEAAGLEPARVKLFIVDDPAINAFVAGGANIFIYTGLLDAMDSPDMLMGVLAHESGHITGGHLARGAEQFRNARASSIIGMVLGAAAAAAGGGQAAAAVLAGSANIAQRNILAFTRLNEQAADQAALQTLARMNVSAEGMLKTFEVLRRRERFAGHIDPYMVTHPLSSERISNIRSALQQSSVPQGQYPRQWDTDFARLRAKLFAFTNLPPQSFARFPEKDASPAARLGRALAWFKKSEIDRSLALMDGLIKDDPANPFNYDLKGQICFESGRIDCAIASYAKAHDMLPENALIAASYADTLLAKKTRTDDEKARGLLEVAVQRDAEHAGAWRSLAVVYGRAGEKGKAGLALAELAVLQGEPQQALLHVDQALKSIPMGSRERLRAEDLKLQATEMKNRKD